MAECEKNRGRARSIKKRDRMKEVQGRTNKVLHRSSSLYEIRTRCASFALPLGVPSFSIVRNQPVLRFFSFVSSTPRFYDFTLCLWFLRFLQFAPFNFCSFLRLFSALRSSFLPFTLVFTFDFFALSSFTLQFLPFPSFSALDNLRFFVYSYLAPRSIFLFPLSSFSSILFFVLGV